MASIANIDSLFDGHIINVLRNGPISRRDIFKHGSRLNSRRGPAPAAVRTFASMLVRTSTSDLGPFNPRLAQRIAADVATTASQEPDKAAAVPAMDVLAYYVAPQGISQVTFLAPYQWGIVLPTAGIEHLARFLVEDLGFSLEHALQASVAMLHGHEYFHHLVAAAAALMESQHRAPRLYEDYRSRAGGPRGYCELEEALANAFAARALADHPDERDALLTFASRQPKGYDHAHMYIGDTEFRNACVDLLALIRDVPSNSLNLSDSLLLDVLGDSTGDRLGGESVWLHTLDSHGSAHEAGEWRLGL